MKFPVLLLLLCGTTLSAFSDQKPNILLVVADDLGYEALGCYGGKDFSTPNLDRFANEGALLTRTYASAVCTPSRMSLYTGLYAVNHGYRSVLPVHVGSKKFVDFSPMPTLPKSMQQAGYETSTTGKWQLAALEHHPDHIRKSGFDSWCVWQIWKDGAKTTRYENPCFNQDGAIREDITNRFGPDVLSEYVIQRMKSATATGTPFYIHHNMLLPHWPIVKTPREKETGQDASLAAMISYMDKLFGDLLAAVSDLGIENNTWIIFLGDNGTDSEKPRHTNEGTVKGGKHQLVEAGIHIPALIRGPGLPGEGLLLDDLIDIADFYPTLAELAGLRLETSANIDGISFAPRLLGKTTKPSRSFVTAAYKNDDCVFDGKWRFHRESGVLYDCRDLPSERRVETDTPESREARIRLEKVILEIKR